MISKRIARAIAATLSIALLGTAAVGCSKKEEQKGTQTEGTTNTQQSTASYPLKTNVTLKYWMDLNPNVSATAANLGDTPFAKGLQEKTGIKVEYIHPAANQATEQLNIMLASGELPDIIEYTWYNFPGGPEKAIQDGYLLKLNDTISKYSPNLKKYLSDNPSIDKMVKTDSGNYYAYPFVRGDELLLTFYGPMLRKDWLTELGLQVPTTIDEWYTVLKAFKDKKNAQAPLSFQMVPVSNGGALGIGDPFIGAFGISRSFYLDNGKVKFGPAEQGFKDFITTFRKWYEEGLIDKNIATVDGKILDANVGQGKTGATIGYAGGTMGKYLTSLTEKEPKFDLVAAPYPVAKKGEIAKFGQKDHPFAVGGNAAITTKSKNVEIAARLLDYGYSKEGAEYFNFGTEGTSYTMKDGKPTYTDLLMKNPDKLPIAHAMGKYIRANYNGPFIQDKGYITQYTQLKQQQDALQTWMKTDVSKTMLPKITPTPEESSEFASIMNEVDAYVNETFLKMMVGNEPVSNFDKFVERLKAMKIDRAIQIQQSALDRFNKR